MEIDFAKQGGLAPAVVQDATTLKILMVGYMNQEALQKTLATRHVTFFSRSRNQLWTKGETSGHFLELVEVKIDCDADTILVKANPIGPTCHTGADTCFFETNTGKAPFLHHLETIIADRHAQMPEGSYTTKLFRKGINKIAQKVGEEAVELVIEAKDDNKNLFLGEAADLLFHFLVLLEAKQIKLDEVIGILQERYTQK